MNQEVLRAVSSGCNSSRGGYSTHSVRLPGLLCASFVLLTAGCRVHTLDDGDYALTPSQILKDDCGLAQEDVLGPATLRTEGNLVTLTLAKTGLRLVGTYRVSTEEMTMDGTLSNFPARLRSRECLLDTVAFHVDTVTTSASTFTGAMSINYQAQQPDECVCQFWFKFDARRLTAASP